MTQQFFVTLTSLKTEVNKLKNEVVAMDQGLFDKSGRRFSPGKYIHNDFNSAAVNKLNELGQNTSAFMAQVDEKLKELQSTLKGLVFKSSTSKARKRKQNKRKGIKGKLARMEKAKTRVLQKVLPRVNHDKVDITIEVEDIFMAALESLSRRGAKAVLHETLKSDNRFSEATKVYISDSLPPSWALSDSESLSDSDSDQ